MLKLPPLSGLYATSGLLLCIIIYFAGWVRTYYRLNHIPGPKGWGWSIIPWLRVHTRPDVCDVFYELSERYGPLVRVAPNIVISSDPEVFRMASAARSPYSRSDWYYAMRFIPGEDHIFSTLDEARHDEKRRKMAAGYSGKENASLEHDINTCLLELINLIDRQYLSRDGDIKPMDLARKIQFFTSDIMSKVAFDHKFNDLRDDNDNHGYIEEMEALFPNLTWTSAVPGFLMLMTKLGLLQKMADAGDSSIGIKKVKSLAWEQVGRRFASEGEGKSQRKTDMLWSFIRHGLSLDEAKQESLLNLTAGSDTSATSMRATFLGIMTNARVYRTLMAEIDEALAQGKIATGPDEIITEVQAKELPYLQACIKEGLRWYPAVTGELSRVSPKDDTIAGYHVPAGTKVGTSVKHLHRNPTLFNPDPHSFRPERWILNGTPIPQGHGHEPSAEKLKAMERNNELVFGFGKYQCLGKPVAMMELNKIFVELLRRFEFEVLTPLKVWDTRCVGTHLQKNMWVVVRKRGGK